MEKHFDVIVIGTGQAGPSIAARFAGEGHQVAIIEKNKFGGTCVNDGCTPTKTMVASARNAHMARRAADFGVIIDGAIKVDMKKVKARKDAIVNASTTGVENWMKGIENLTVIEEHARFTANKTIQVGEDTLIADRIFINIGGRAHVPEGFESVPYLTNTSLMEVDFVPEHLIVVGGSYIGLEFGQMFRRFGSEVTIIEMGDRIIRREDPDVSQVVHEVLEAEGINFRLEAECLTGRMDGDEVIVEVECATGDRFVKGSHLLLATGRTPNTNDLGLENTDIETFGRGYIRVNDYLETNVHGVYAVGDCNGRGGFTHTSYNDHEIVVANLLDDDNRKVTDRILCYSLFVDPPLSRIGMSEKEAVDSGIKILKGFREMKSIARAKEKGETAGFVKILVDADTHKILGATIIGVDGDEAIHSLLDVMYADAPYTTISRAVHIHPTVSELLPTILQGLEAL